MFTHNGTQRNYRIVGLSDENTVITQVDGKEPEDSGEKPSEWMANRQWCPWITRRERGILSRGVTATGRDREHPK